jgi:hypothetical protein
MNPETPHGTDRRSFLRSAGLIGGTGALLAIAPALLSACGAYDLPLCEAIGRRYGCTTLALGPQILSRFGVRPDAPTLQQPKA